MRKLVKAIRRVYRSGEKGFTLIELLVVIGILAALAGVVTLGVTQFIGSGQEEACQTDWHNVQTAVAAFAWWTVYKLHVDHRATPQTAWSPATICLAHRLERTPWGPLAWLPTWEIPRVLDTHVLSV